MKRRLWGVIFCFFLLLLGCPATPPSGPAEIPGPMSLRFPSSLAIDVSKIASEDASALKVSGKDFIGTFGVYSQIVAMGAEMASNVVNGAGRVVTEGGPLGNVVVDIDPSRTSYSTTVPSDEGDFGGAEIKIDFSRFTSVKEETLNCSGSTAGDIVCYRVWVGGERFMAGFFTAIPGETNDGAGHLWLNPSVVPTEAQIGVSWDHSDPADKTLEMFVDGAIDDGISLDHAHFFIHQQGEDEATSIKTLKTTATISSESSVEAYYIGRWKESDDFWSGKVDFTSDGGNYSIPTTCVRISTGDGAEAGNCVPIDTVAEEFLEHADEGAFVLPEDFPLSPTF